MSLAKAILTELKKQQVTHIVGIPDNGSRALYERLWDDPDIAVVQVSREGEAFGVAAGLYLGGAAAPLVLIQNTGLLEAGDALRGMAYNKGIPLVALIGYRGYATLAPDAERVDSTAAFLEPTLKAWKVPYSILLPDGDAALISSAFATAASTSLPAAVLFVGELS